MASSLEYNGFEDKIRALRKSKFKK